MVDHPAVAEAEAAAEVPFDTSDPVQVNTARKKAARKTRGKLDVVGAVMEQKEGRSWIYGMLADAHMWTPSYVRGDSHATAFQEGERNAGLRLLTDVMAAAPQLYVTMVAENKTNV